MAEGRRGGAAEGEVASACEVRGGGGGECRDACMMTEGERSGDGGAGVV